MQCNSMHKENKIRIILYIIYNNHTLHTLKCIRIGVTTRAPMLEYNGALRCGVAINTYREIAHMRAQKIYMKKLRWRT